MVNGAKLSAELEPRVTLLDALRNNFAITGAKRVCDRGECGACTVLMDGKTIYACTILAIDAQGQKIETVESLPLAARFTPSSRRSSITTLSSADSARLVSSWPPRRWSTNIPIPRPSRRAMSSPGTSAVAEPTRESGERSKRKEGGITDADLQMA